MQSPRLTELTIHFVPANREGVESWPRSRPLDVLTLAKRICKLLYFRKVLTFRIAFKLAVVSDKWPHGLRNSSQTKGIKLEKLA